MSEVRPRIIGSETETPISVVGSEPDALPQPIKHTADFVTEYLPAGLSSLSEMLSNGARYYIDQKHAEYATPEVCDFEEFVVREFAGERIVMHSLAAYMRDNPDTQQAFIRKRVIDDASRTWGYHVNLSADVTRLPWLTPENAHLLALHIATSQPMLGGGAIIRGRAAGQQRYSFGQKVFEPELVDFNNDTIYANAIVNQRREPLADQAKYARVHLTCVDPHVSPWAAMMFPGTVSLVLRAMEQGKDRGLHAFHDSIMTYVRIARVAATDLAFNQLVRMEDDRHMRVLDIQQEIIDIVSRTEYTDAEAYILNEWQRALTDLQQDPMRLRDRSDAIARWSLIQSMNIRAGNEPNDTATRAARHADAYYDRTFELGTRRVPREVDDYMQGYLVSRAAKVRSGQMSKYMVDEPAIESAILSPPTDTRAFGRAAVVAQGSAGSVQWDRYSIGDRMTLMLDPYNPSHVS